MSTLVMENTIPQPDKPSWACPQCKIVESYEINGCVWYIIKCGTVYTTCTEGDYPTGGWQPTIEEVRARLPKQKDWL